MDVLISIIVCVIGGTICYFLERAMVRFWIEEYLTEKSEEYKNIKGKYYIVAEFKKKENADAYRKKVLKED